MSITISLEEFGLAQELESKTKAHAIEAIKGALSALGIKEHTNDYIIRFSMKPLSKKQVLPVALTEEFLFSKAPVKTIVINYSDSAFTDANGKLNAKPNLESILGVLMLGVTASHFTKDELLNSAGLWNDKSKTKAKAHGVRVVTKPNTAWGVTKDLKSIVALFKEQLTTVGTIPVSENYNPPKTDDSPSTKRVKVVCSTDCKIYEIGGMRSSITEDQIHLLGEAYPHPCGICGLPIQTLEAFKATKGKTNKEVAEELTKTL